VQALLLGEVGPLEQVLVHAYRALGLAAAAEQTGPGRSAARPSSGATFTTSMNASIALSGCSFSRKFSPRK